MTIEEYYAKYGDDHYEPHYEGPNHKIVPSKELEEWTDKYWCVCGQPEKAYDALNDILSIYESGSHGESWHWGVNLKKFNKIERKYGKSLHLIMYLLDGIGITEHGGSYFGSWLTGLGKELKVFIENGIWDEEQKD